MENKWASKFKIKSGKWAYVPTEHSRLIGKQIKSSIEKIWSPPKYYFHLMSGGHLAALSHHLSKNFFFRIDLENLFGSINRSRVTRSLNKRFNYKTSREWANASTIFTSSNAKKYFLPFGFVQSSILASLCLYDSSLGKTLHFLSKSKSYSVSIYVDDIIISGNSIEDLQTAFSLIEKSSLRSNFLLNQNKIEGPQEKITVFNIEISTGQLKISDSRMAKFEKKISDTTLVHSIEGIRSYIFKVSSLNAV